MGQLLSWPATSKQTHGGSNTKFAFAISEMQGWRVSMEDAHAVELNLDQNGDMETNAFFAVYDGHGGSAVSRYAGENVHKRLLTETAYNTNNFPEALKRAFLGTDEDMRGKSEFARDASGCTAVAAVVTKDNRLFVANAGDSRSVISVKGLCEALSFDHKPSNDLEKKRVLAAGGYVEYGRVNGNLALSRALGDFEYKKNKSLSAEAQIITCDPEVTEHQITEEDEFFIVACDGIWDCLSSQQCVDVVRRLVAQGKKLTEVCEAVCDLCLAPDTNSGAGIGCDNMTMMVIALLHGRTEEEWYEWVKSSVERDVGYSTPINLPAIYTEARLNNYTRRKALHEESERARERERAEQEQWIKDHPEEYAQSGFPRQSAPGAFERGGIFEDILREMQASGDIRILSSDDDDDDDLFDGGFNEDGEAYSFATSDALQNHDEPDADGDHKMLDVTLSLKQQVDELVRGDSSARQGEAPPPPLPNHVPNGDIYVEQLKSNPGGDASSDAVRAEGLSDGSEGLIKA